MLDLRGPFRLADGDVERVVPDGTGGVFAFGLLNAQARVGVIAAIGRSDADLRREIERGIGHYDAFLFATCRSPGTAFDLECELYHRLQYRPDFRHPAAPQGSDWLCPVCAANWQAQHLLNLSLQAG